MKRFKLNKIQKALLIFGIFIIYISIGLYYDLTITSYDITSNKLPKSFDGFKIANISDLHCSYFGENQEELIDALVEYKPDIIVLTGDIIDEKNPDFHCIETLVSGITSIAPVYSVSGNHEHSNYKNFLKLNALYESYNVTVLDDEEISITRGNDEIRLYGLSYFGTYTDDTMAHLLSDRLTIANEDYYSILLNHRSDIFDELSEYQYDLVISGHTHGGIIRLPLVGGILSNDRTFFPKYDGGIFEQNNSTLISSKGLGESNSIPRFYNRRELVFITLHCS